MEEKDIGALIRYGPGGRVYLIIVQFLWLISYISSAIHHVILFSLSLWQLVKQFLGYFPSVQLLATVSPITRTVLKVFSTATLIHAI